MSRNRIARDNKGTGNVLDDTYYLNMNGGIYELLYIGNENEVKTYRIESHPDWVLKYHISNDQWEVLQDDGTKYVYGDGGLNGGHISNSTEYLIHWGNWIGSSSVVDGQKRLASAWNVAIEENIYGQQVKFHYDQSQEQVGDNGLYFTKASYLDTVTGYEGERIVLSYASKDFDEYVDPHQKKIGEPGNDRDAYQERFETKYLSKLSLFNFYGELKDVIELSYTFLNEGNPTYKKRVLTHIYYKNLSGRIAEPPSVFDYYGLSSEDGLQVYSTADSTTLYNTEKGALYGALKSVRLQEGVVYQFKYDEQVMDSSQRDIDLVFPDPFPYYSSHIGEDMVTCWYAPELIFAGTYVVAIYNPIALDCYWTHLQVYEWLGDHWEKQVDEALPGVYYDNYKALDAIDPSTINKLKNEFFGEVNKAVPALGGLMNAFSDALSDEVQGYVTIGKDLSKGDVGGAVVTYLEMPFNVLKDVGEDIFAGIEKGAQELIDVACDGNVSDFCYLDYQKQLYATMLAKSDTLPRQEYHITTQKDFFALCSDRDSFLLIYQKDPTVEGKWITSTFKIRLASHYFQIQSGENFIAMLDQVLDMVWIYTWDGMDWNTSFFTLRTGQEQNSSGLSTQDSIAAFNASVSSHADHIAAIGCRNNLIVATMKEQGYSGALKAWTIYHDENLEWHANHEPVQVSLQLEGLAKGMMDLLFGANGAIVIQPGESFAAIQTYSHLSNELPTVEDIPVAGEFIENFVADPRKMNATYGLTWDENFQNLQLEFLHMGRAQSDIGIQVNGDVINKVGRAHSLLIGNDNLFPDDGENYAFRYNGNRFQTKKFQSEYYATAFGQDLSSTLNTNADALSKTPQFYQFDPNQNASNNNLEHLKTFNDALLEMIRLKEAGDTNAIKNYASNTLLPALSAITQDDSFNWSLIDNISKEEIPTSEELDEIVKVTVDAINLLIQIVTAEIPGFGEEMATEEEAMSAAKMGQQAVDQVFGQFKNPVFYLQSITMDLIESLMAPSPYGTSVMDNYITINGKLFTRNADESWTEISQYAFDDKDATLIGTSNKLCRGYYPFTLNNNGKITNEVVLLKNGTLYKKIRLNENNMVVHEDSISQVAGDGAFVSYGLLDPDKPGFVLTNPQRKLYLPLIEENAKKRKMHPPYKDATRVRLHRVIQNGVTGPLSDYVVRCVEVNDGYNTYAHNYLYQSGQYDASSGSAIYGKVTDVTSPMPISDLNQDKIPAVATAGYTEHFFYNRHNYYTQNGALGFPENVQILLMDALVEFEGKYFTDSIDFRKLPVKQLFARPWLTATFDGRGSLMDQQVTNYKIWESDFYHPAEDTLLGVTNIYVVKPKRLASIRDGVVEKVEYEYSPFSVKLRNTTHFAVTPDGLVEKNISQFTYAYELVGELIPLNRLTEIQQTTTYYQRGDGPVIKTGANVIAYDSIQFLPQATYLAKLSDELNAIQEVDHWVPKDYILVAAKDVADQDTAIEAYEKWLYKTEVARGNFAKAQSAANAAHQAAMDSHDQLGTLKAKVPQIKASDNANINELNTKKKLLDGYSSKIDQAENEMGKLELKRYNTEQSIKEIEKINREIKDINRDKAIFLLGCGPFAGLFCLFGLIPFDDAIGDLEDKRDALIRQRDDIVLINQAIQTKQQEILDHESETYVLLERIDILKATIQEEEMELEQARASIRNIESQQSQIKEEWKDLITDSPEAIHEEDHVGAQAKHNAVIPKLENINSLHKNFQNSIAKLFATTPDSLFSNQVTLKSFQDSLSSDTLNTHLSNLQVLSNHHRTMHQQRTAIGKAKESKPEGYSSKWIQNHRIFKRDSVSGVPLSWENAKNAKSSIALDKYHRNTLVHMDNVNLQDKEAFYYGFEKYESLTKKQAKRICEKDAHTGNNSFKAGISHRLDFPDFSPRSEVYKKDSLYVLSGWVKKRCFLNGRVKIKNGGTKDRIKIRGKKKWQYVEKLVRQPAVGKEGLKLLARFLLVDDLMLRPLNSIAHTFTYTDNDQIDSETDNNGLTVRHVYDTHQRHLISVDDANRVHHFEHHSFSASDSEAFHAKHPNGLLSIHFQGAGKLLTRDKKKGFVHREIHPALDEYVIAFNLAQGNSPTFKISLNEAILAYSAGGLTFNAQPFAQNIGVPETWAIIKTGGYLYVYGDGRLLGHQQLQLNTSQKNKQITVDGQGLYYVFVGLDPVIQQHYLDGMGRQIQQQHLSYNEAGKVIGKVVSGTIYDGWGNVFAQSLNALIDQPNLNYEPNFITGLDQATGQLSGEIISYFSGQNEIADFTAEDSKFPYHGFVYEASPIHRKTRNIPPGAFFYTQPYNQQQIDYQDKYGSALANEIDIKTPIDKQFSSTTFTDPNDNKHINLHDGLNRLIASKTGNSITKYDQLFNENSSSFLTQFPNHFALSPSDLQNSPTSFVNLKEHRDLLGLFQVNYDLDEGTLTTIKDHSGEPAFYIRNKARLGRGKDNSKHAIEFYKYDQRGRHIEEGIVDTTTYDFALLETMANARFWDDDHAHTYRYWNYDSDEEGNTLHLLGRLQSSIHQQGKHYITEKYQYNLHGQTILIEQSDSLEQKGSEGKLIKREQTKGKIAYDYFPDGKLKSITYPNKELVSYTYDQLGQMKGVGTPADPFKYAKYSYTIDGHIKEIQYDNNAFQEHRSYNLQSHISARTYQQDDEIDFQQIYETNNRVGHEPYLQGNITGIKESGRFLNAAQEQHFAYDDQYRLESVKGINNKLQYEYTYDANGNMLSSTEPGGKTSYAYEPGTNIRKNKDANNGLLTKISSPLFGVASISFDPYTFMPLKVSGANKAQTNFLYDAHNNRVGKTTSLSNRIDTVTYYRGDHALPLSESKSGHYQGKPYQHTKNLIYGHGFAPIATQHDGKDTYFHQRDHLGSLRFVLDQQNKKVAAFDYTPFGALDAHSIDHTLNQDGVAAFTYLYTGQEYDRELNLHNYRARLYSPEEKIFLTPDPVREYASPYAYVSNDPVNHVDLDGKVKKPAADPKLVTRGRNTTATFTVHPHHLGTGTATDDASRTWVRTQTHHAPQRVQYNYTIHDGQGNVFASHTGTVVNNDLARSRHQFPDAGHIRARSMGGDGTSHGNLFAQMAELNRGNDGLYDYWRRAESNVVRNVRTGYIVDVEIRFWR